MPPDHSDPAAPPRRPAPGPMRSAAWAPLAALAALVADPAGAAGGAHVIDDAAVETPGTCHLESWAGLSSGDGGVAVASPGCTSKALPELELELDAFLSHGWTRAGSETLAGLAAKFALHSAEDSAGIAVTTSLAWRIDRDRKPPR